MNTPAGGIDMQRIVDIIINTHKANQYVFTVGNGGSSSTASHFTNDLVKGCSVYGRPGIRSICLTDSSTLLTCLSYDFSYDEALMMY